MDSAQTSDDELTAFEAATRDLVGVALRSIEEFPVSLPQFRLLSTLATLGRAGSTECARALGVAGSSVTRLADRLDASGHLIRGTSPTNRSVVLLELTDSGRRIVDEVTAHRRRALRHALDTLEPGERAACAVALGKIHTALTDGGIDWPQHGMPF